MYDNHGDGEWFRPTGHVGAVVRVCRNRRCSEDLDDGERLLCPACRYIGKWAFAVGAVLAGLLTKWFS